MNHQSEVVFDEESNARMPYQKESNENETEMFGLAADKSHIMEKDHGDEHLWGQDSEHTQPGKRSTSHLHGVPYEEAESIAHS